MRPLSGRRTMSHIYRRHSLWIMLICAPAALAQTGARVDGKEIRIDFNQSLHSRVVARLDGKEIVIGAFAPSEYITVAGNEVKNGRGLVRKRNPIRGHRGPYRAS